MLNRIPAPVDLGGEFFDICGSDDILRDNGVGKMHSFQCLCNHKSLSNRDARKQIPYYFSSRKSIQH